MVGQGIETTGYHPVADLLSDDETLQRLEHIRGVIAQTARAMPRQADYLRQIGCGGPGLKRAS